MRIMVDGRALKHDSITGVERYIMSVVSTLQELTSDLVVAQPSTRSRLKQHLWEQFILPRQAREANVDVLFCPANIGPARTAGAYRQVVVLHSVSYLECPDSYSRFFRRYYSLLVPKVTAASCAVVTVSEAERDIILKHYPCLEKKLVVVANGVDDDFHPEPIERDGSILYIGSIAPAKNLKSLFEAYALALPKIPQKLVVVGGSGDQFKDIHQFDEVLSRVPPHRIEFAGHVNGSEELRNYYCRADFLVFPSLYESSGLPPIESMACGTPVIASDIPALRERCGDAALYCNPNNPQDIADRIVEMATRPDLRSSLASKGLEQAKMYSWKKTGRELMDICHQVCSDAFNPQSL